MKSENTKSFFSEKRKIIPKWTFEKNIDNGAFISARVRLARNLAAYPFGENLGIESANAMVERLRVVTQANNRADYNVGRLTWLNVEAMDIADKSYYLENHLASPALLKSNGPRGLLSSEDGRIGIMLNEEDHVRIQCVTPYHTLIRAFEGALDADSFLGDLFEFAYDDELGYKTACITNVGTGMRASYMMHLPGITKAGLLKEVREKLGASGHVIRGMHGEGTDSLGNLYQISNQFTLGFSEKEIIDMLISLVAYVEKTERDALSKIKERDQAGFEAGILESYGRLRYTNHISLKDACLALSDIWVALSGWANVFDVNNLSIPIYRIMLECQPGHFFIKHPGMRRKAPERALATYLNHMTSFLIPVKLPYNTPKQTREEDWESDDELPF